MRSLQDMFKRSSGTQMNPAHYIAWPDGRAFPLQLDEGLCLCLFGSKERAEEFIAAILPEPYRSQCRVGTWYSYEQVEAWMKREGGSFDVLSTGASPDPAATAYYQPIGDLLTIARGEVRG